MNGLALALFYPLNPSVEIKALPWSRAQLLRAGSRTSHKYKLCISLVSNSSLLNRKGLFVLPPIHALD